MSQNIYFVSASSIGAALITAGWDEPLQEMFCNVQAQERFRMEQEDYPSCLLRTSFSKVREIVDSLKVAQISLPKQMIEAIENDCRNRTGNKVRVFNEDGTVQAGKSSTP